MGSSKKKLTTSTKQASMWCSMTIWWEVIEILAWRLVHRVLKFTVICNEHWKLPVLHEGLSLYLWVRHTMTTEAFSTACAIASSVEPAARKQKQS